MNKKAAVGVGVAALLLVMCAGAIFATDWNNEMNYETPQKIPFSDVVDENKEIDNTSLNYALFEKFGPILLVLAILMFGAMIGGVCIAREESEHNDTD